jgi:hypothetical protein
MTMLYVEVSLQDLQREFNLALSQPRHRLPASPLPASIRSPQANLASLLDSLHLGALTIRGFPVKTLAAAAQGQVRELRGKLR